MSETLVQELLQQCSTCRSTKLLETYFSKNVKGQYMKTCDKCRVRLKENKAKKSEQRKKYRENNKEKLVEAKKKYYEENKDKIAEHRKKQYHENREKSLEKSRKYYQQNKEAVAEYNKKYNIENRERLAEQSKIYRGENKEKLVEAKKKYYEENKDKIAEHRKKHYHENRESILEQKKIYFQENKETIAEYKTQYYKDKRHYCDHNTIKKICKICDPNGKLKALVSSRIYHALKANKLKKSIEYLGCDIQTFKEHLEKTFKEGMNWDNHGDWEIDHYCPIMYSEDGNPPSTEEVCERLHYTNTQAMWQPDNRTKSNRYIG